MSLFPLKVSEFKDPVRFPLMDKDFWRESYWGPHLVFHGFLHRDHSWRYSEDSYGVLRIKPGSDTYKASSLSLIPSRKSWK